MKVRLGDEDLLDEIGGDRCGGGVVRNHALVHLHQLLLLLEQPLPLKAFPFSHCSKQTTHGHHLSCASQWRQRYRRSRVTDTARPSWPSPLPVAGTEPPLAKIGLPGPLTFTRMPDMAVPTGHRHGRLLVIGQLKPFLSRASQDLAMGPSAPAHSTFGRLPLLVVGACCGHRLHRILRRCAQIRAPG
jgi:hypothetical protein